VALGYSAGGDLIEMAHHGTLFIDRIERMSIDCQ
jgi:DNA-binding NtrC family response regulator